MRLLLLIFLLAGCSASPEHALKIERYRAMLPYLTRHTSESMEPRFRPGQIDMVVRFPYDKLRGGMDALFLPEGCSIPVAHRIGHRIGTDSWSTYGIHNDRDDTYRWILTRDNYIGVIR